MDLELIALQNAGNKIEWLHNLLVVPLWTRPISSISINCDNTTTIAQATSKIYNGKRRHVFQRQNVIRQIVSNEISALEFVKSEVNLVDPLTKLLTRKLIIETSKGMKLNLI